MAVNYQSTYYCFALQTKSLSSPYGNCTVDRELEYFPGEAYTRDKCLAQCEADHTVHSCHCKDVYMPGKHMNTVFYFIGIFLVGIKLIGRTQLIRKVVEYGVLHNKCIFQDRIQCAI